MKTRFSIFILITVVFAFLGCDANQTNQNAEENTLNNYRPTDSSGFDWSINPLTVNLIEEELISSMDAVDLDTVKSNIYNYFYLQQTGDSVDYVKHFEYYPSLFDEDTMKNAFVNTTIKWWNMGYRNIFETVDINYASDWIVEENQKVALIGFDLKFRTEFSEKYPSDPMRLIEALKRQMPRADIEFIDERPIRSIVVYDKKGLFVYTPLDKYEFTFLSEDEGRQNSMDTIMLRDTRLNLLRDKREALK